MTAPLDEETSTLLRAFEDGTLDAFPHAAHVRVAWAYARALPLMDAIAKTKAGIMRLATAKGAPEKYHETITWAFVVLVHEKVAADPELAWGDFARAHPELFDAGALRRYYSPETLASPLARRAFVLPDARR